MLLDSTYLTDLLRADPGAVETLETLIREETPVAVSSLTVFEVGAGLRRIDDRHRETFADAVDDLEEVPPDVRATRRALEVQRRLYDRGESIRAVDALIAGTALERTDGAVLTRNVEAFERVDGLTVETY